MRCFALSWSNQRLRLRTRSFWPVIERVRVSDQSFGNPSAIECEIVVVRETRCKLSVAFEMSETPSQPPSVGGDSTLPRDNFEMLDFPPSAPLEIVKEDHSVSSEGLIPLMRHYWNPEELQHTIGVYAKERVTWLILIFTLVILCIPAIIGYLQARTNRLPNLWEGIPVTMQSGGFEMILSAFNGSGTVLKLISGLVIIYFGREVYKDRMLKMIRNRETATLDTFTEVFCSLMANQPAIVLFTNQAMTYSSILCALLFILV
ncbi:hypothetical protein EDD86DRAFT_149114 [Gorgonomyces haynaldii]|nr:hypothetical protein EDD86DRAFT_149114 [Gorgonomyces haynaldii]